MGGRFAACLPLRERIRANMAHGLRHVSGPSRSGFSLSASRASPCADEGARAMNVDALRCRASHGPGKLRESLHRVACRSAGVLACGRDRKKSAARRRVRLPTTVAVGRSGSVRRWGGNCGGVALCSDSLWRRSGRGSCLSRSRAALTEGSAPILMVPIHSDQSRPDGHGTSTTGLAARTLRDVQELPPVSPGDGCRDQDRAGVANTMRAS